MKSVFSIECLRLSFFPIVLSWIVRSLIRVHFTWKSIIQAKHVIDLGPVWRIGNDQSVKIREDRWLPQISASKIVSLVSVLPPGSKVCDLIDQEKHQWKAYLIAQDFLPHEAHIIKGII